MIVLEFTELFQKGANFARSCSFDLHFTLGFVATYPMEGLVAISTELGCVYLREQVKTTLGQDVRLVLQEATNCLQLKNEAGLLDGNVQLFQEAAWSGAKP